MTTKIFDGSVRVPISKQTAIAMSGGCGFDISPPVVTSMTQITLSLTTRQQI